MEKIDLENLNQYSEYAIEFVMTYGPRFIGGVVVLLLGWWLTNKFTNTVNKVMERRNIEPSLRTFLKTLLLNLLRVLVIFTVMGMIGVEMTSFIAILGAAGLAVGLALSGTLQNFAGGVIILLMKPYKVGDVIEAQGFIGSVAEIQIFNTILKTWDNKTIVIPNSQLSNNSLVNYTTEPVRKVEWVFGISYGDDIDKARQIIKDVVYADERVLDTEEDQFINLFQLADSSVNFKVRASVNGADYWQVFFDMTERVKKAFDASGITIPFPQRDVHMYESK